MIRARRVTQLAQCLGLDLTNTLTGHIELLAHLFQCVIRVHADTEAHSEHFRFPRGEAGQDFRGGLAQTFVDG